MITRTLPERSKVSGAYPRCFENHPALSIGEFKIYGGSCSSPVITNADIYIGFDLSMRHSVSQYPWEPGESVLFPIPDMGVPKDVEEFKKMIKWLAVQLIANKLIHLGCIGGHGRTGMVLAALVTEVTGNKDSITYVRANYCHKAVESASQVRFLHTNFGITEVEATKSYASVGHGIPSGKDWYASKGYPQASNPMGKGKHAKIPGSDGIPNSRIFVEPTTNPINIWGTSILFNKPSKPDTIELIHGGT